MRTSIATVCLSGSLEDKLAAAAAAGFPVSIASVVREQIRVIGSLIYDHPSDFRETIGLLASHTVTPSAILGPPSDFACVPEAMAGAAEYAGKSWISFS